MALTIQILTKTHHRGNFNSETPLLDNYLKYQASQDARRDLTACYVLTGSENKVLGYYTISSNSIPQEDLPQDLANKLRLPKSYINLPAILLGRLAVDQEHKGKGYGEVLLMDAMERCLDLATQLGTLAIIVDPLDDNAVRFYKKYGFLQLESTQKMFLPIETIRKLIKD